MLMLNAHAVGQTYRDTLNYYRRHITSSRFFFFCTFSGSYCTRSNAKRKGRSSSACPCIVFHLLFCGQPKRINKIKYAECTALVFMVTFVSSLFVHKPCIIMLYYSLIAHYATIYLTKRRWRNPSFVLDHRSRLTVDNDWLQLYAPFSLQSMNIGLFAFYFFIFLWFDPNAMHVPVNFWHRWRLISALGDNWNTCFYSLIWIGMCAFFFHALKMHNLPGIEETSGECEV